MPEHQLDRRSFLAGAAGVASAAAQTPDARQRPNILHIMTDQQQWATIAGRSICRTPNINRLAGQGLLFERSYTPSAVCCPARAMLLSGAYHWHNGVYNQVHSAPSVHRDMNPDVVLYSQRLREAGYRLGYVGKWHASYLRTPLDFGFQELAGGSGCDPALLQNLDLNPDRVPLSTERIKVTNQRMMRWPGSEPFAMWGYREGPEEATPEWRNAELASRMMARFALQTVARSEQRQANGPTGFDKAPGGHETVAAIVAGAGDHQDRPLLHQFHRGLCDGLPRAEHQREARRARGDCEPIGTFHFSSRENFHAKSLVQAPHPEAFFMPRAAKFPMIAY